MTVKAVSCVSGVPSQVSSETYIITPGPVVEVTIRLEGSISAADMDDAAKDTFKKSFAELINIAPELISLSVSNADARRRLLAVDLKMEILADSSDSAQKIQEDVQKADLGGIDLPPGATVGDITVRVNDPSKPKTTPSVQPPEEKKSNLPVIIASAVAGVVAVSLMLAFLLFYLRRKRFAQTDLKLVSVDSEPLPPSLEEPPSLQESPRSAEGDDAEEAALTVPETEEPRELAWADLTNALSSMQFLSSDLVTAPYAAPQPMEPMVADGGLTGGALLNPGQLHSNSASVISLTRAEVEERLMFTGTQSTSISPRAPKEPQPSASVLQSPGYRSKEEIRRAGQAELAEMRDETDAGSRQISMKPAAGTGWGLELLLPGLLTGEPDPAQTPPRAMSLAAAGSRDSISPTRDISIDFPSEPASYQPVPRSPDTAAPQSTLWTTTASTARSDASSVKDRFKANLAKLKKFEK